MDYPYLAASIDNLPLVSTIAVGLGAALIFGIFAVRLKLSPIVGYLLAGILVGPNTPGFVGDVELAKELSEIGVMLLMFGVGLHFSLEDLLSVKNIALPGALVQVGIATLMGVGLGYVLDWPLIEGIIFGLALSCASTVVLLRALEDHRILVTERGRIAMGWLIVEDILMVLALVLIPAVTTAMRATESGIESDGNGVWTSLLITLGKVAAFIAIMLGIGAKVLPWTLERISRVGSRELFTLSVLGTALGIAYGAAYVFDVSLALGAFFAGMVLNGSDLSHDAAEQSLPLRDAFAVLFFVAVGMLFDPAIIVHAPLSVLAAVFIVVVGKSLASYVIVLAFGYGNHTALTISASLAQVGEFSFILAALGMSEGILTQHQHDLVLAAALVSITLNPVMFNLISKMDTKTGRLERLLGRRLRKKREDEEALRHAEEVQEKAETLEEHIILVGYGGVGAHTVKALQAEKKSFIIMDTDESVVFDLNKAGVDAVHGNAATDGSLELVGIEKATHLLIAVPNAYEAGEIARLGRQLNPNLRIVARVQSDEETKFLLEHGANTTVVGEMEIGQSLARIACVGNV